MYSRRIIYSNNSVLSDVSKSLTDYYSDDETLSIVASEDAIYIGQRMPFNHLYFKMGTVVNAIVSNINIAYWDRQNWIPCAEIMDETSSSGKTLAKSGFITWVPDRNKLWAQQSTNHNADKVTDLTALNIYDLYWIKITFSVSLTASIKLSWIGNLFSDDNDLGAEFPDLVRSTVMTAFKAGKTTFEEQHYLAAEIVKNDLRSKNVILDQGQILDKNDLKLASVMKCAEIIYSAFGDSYKDNRTDARKEYELRINKSLPKVDTYKTATVEIDNYPFTMGGITR